MSEIKGYRELSSEELEVINLIKAVADEIGLFVDKVMENDDTDKRWVSIARTDLQTGFMALIRSIAKPTSF
jgi:hypothetical protein